MNPKLPTFSNPTPPSPFGTMQGSTPATTTPQAPTTRLGVVAQAPQKAISSATQGALNTAGAVAGGVGAVASYPYRYAMSDPNKPAPSLFPQQQPAPSPALAYQPQQGVQFKPNDTTAQAIAPKNPDGSVRTNTGAVIQPDGTVASPASQFSIDTGNITSDALDHSYTTQDIAQKRTAYQDAVAKLAEASGYSPDYISAYKAKTDAELNARTMKEQYYNGTLTPSGTTSDYAGATYSRASGLNSVEADRANAALQVQALIRNGDIAGASALVEAMKPSSLSYGQTMVNPVTGETIAQGASYTDKQAYDTAFNLLQSYPDSGVQYNQSLTPQQNLTSIMQGVQNAPSYIAKNMVKVSLPNGGIGFADKRQVSGNIDPATGLYTLLDSASAGQMKAQGAAQRIQQTTLSSARVALNTADENFSNLVALAQEKGINDSIPVANVLKNKAKFNMGDQDIAAFQSGLEEISTEYQTVFAKTGQVTDSVRSSTSKIIDPSMTIGQLKAVVSQIKQQGEVAIQKKQQEIDRLGGGSSGGGVGLSWDNL